MVFRSYPAALATLAVALALGACAADPEPAPIDPVSTTNVVAVVAPLTLPGLSDACYDIRVASGNETVWSRGTPGEPAPGQTDSGALCSHQFGSGTGGDVTYTGPCDATGDGAQALTLWVDSLWSDPTTRVTDWTNPCPADANGGGGCTIAFACRENADAPVNFNLTIMRRADQGFFDVAVSFADVFCSAKLDCTYDPEGKEPIEGLFHGTEPDQTAVLGFACTGGTGESKHTYLHVSDLRLACDPFAGAVPLEMYFPITGVGSVANEQAWQGLSDQGLDFGQLVFGSVLGVDATDAAHLAPHVEGYQYVRNGSGAWVPLPITVDNIGPILRDTLHVVADLTDPANTAEIAKWKVGMLRRLGSIYDSATSDPPMAFMLGELARPLDALSGAPGAGSLPVQFSVPVILSQVAAVPDPADPGTYLTPPGIWHIAATFDNLQREGHAAPELQLASPDRVDPVTRALLVTTPFGGVAQAHDIVYAKVSTDPSPAAYATRGARLAPPTDVWIYPAPDHTPVRLDGEGGALVGCRVTRFFAGVMAGVCVASTPGDAPGSTNNIAIPTVWHLADRQADAGADFDHIVGVVLPAPADVATYAYEEPRYTIAARDTGTYLSTGFSIVDTSSNATPSVVSGTFQHTTSTPTNGNCGPATAPACGSGLCCHPGDACLEPGATCVGWERLALAHPPEDVADVTPNDIEVAFAGNGYVAGSTTMDVEGDATFTYNVIARAPEDFGALGSETAWASWSHFTFAGSPIAEPASGHAYELELGALTRVASGAEDPHGALFVARLRPVQTNDSHLVVGVLTDPDSGHPVHTVNLVELPLWTGVTPDTIERADLQRLPDGSRGFWLQFDVDGTTASGLVSVTLATDNDGYLTVAGTHVRRLTTSAPVGVEPVGSVGGGNDNDDDTLEAFDPHVSGLLAIGQAQQPVTGFIFDLTEPCGTVGAASGTCEQALTPIEAPAWFGTFVPGAASATRILDMMTDKTGNRWSTHDSDPLTGPWDVDPEDRNDHDIVWQYAQYFGREALTCDPQHAHAGSCNKRYFNLAIGLSTGTPNCWLDFDATASETSWAASGNRSPDGKYPVIHYVARLTDESGELACRTNSLGGTLPGVATLYTPMDEPARFCYEFGETTLDSGDDHITRFCNCTDPGGTPTYEPDCYAGDAARHSSF